MREPERAGASHHDAVATASATLTGWLEAAEGPSVLPRTRRLLRLVEPVDQTPAPTDSDASIALRARGGRFDGPDPLVMYAGESWRLCRDGSLRRWDVATSRWVSIARGRWSESHATVVDIGGEREAAGDDGLARSEDDLTMPVIEGCTYLGGPLDEICLYAKYAIAFGEPFTRLLSHQAGAVEIPFEDLVSVELIGEGRVETAGASELGLSLTAGRTDMAAATVVRSLVERTRMDSSIRIETMSGPAVFHCEGATPDALRTSLRPFLTLLDRGAPEDGDRSGADIRADVAGQLRELADLRVADLLTEEEFIAAKAAVLGRRAQK